MATKEEYQPDTSEFETRERAFEKNVRVTRMAESARLALMVVALLAGLTIVGTSADTLSVYDKTHVSTDFLLPLSGVWPSEFDLRPTIALVTCGTIIAITSAIALIASKASSVRHHISFHLCLILTLSIRSDTTPSSTAPSPALRPPSVSLPASSARPSTMASIGPTQSFRSRLGPASSLTSL